MDDDDSAKNEKVFWHELMGSVSAKPVDFEPRDTLVDDKEKYASAFDKCLTLYRIGGGGKAAPDRKKLVTLANALGSTERPSKESLNSKYCYVLDS